MRSRWSFAIVLREKAGSAIQFERIEMGAHGHTVETGGIKRVTFNRRLDARSELRQSAVETWGWVSAASPQFGGMAALGHLTIERRFIGKDAQGQTVVVPVRVELHRGFGRKSRQPSVPDQPLPPAKLLQSGELAGLAGRWEGYYQLDGFHVPAAVTVGADGAMEIAENDPVTNRFRGSLSLRDGRVAYAGRDTGEFSLHQDGGRRVLAGRLFLSTTGAATPVTIPIQLEPVSSTTATATAMPPAPRMGTPLAGSSGGVRWEIVDVIQSDLKEERALRWDYVVTLQADMAGRIQFEQFEYGVGTRTVGHRPFRAVLPRNGLLRSKHFDRSPSGADRVEVFRRYHGRDDAGNVIILEVRAVLDRTMGTRPRRTGTFTPIVNTAAVSMPTDATVVPPDTRLPPEVASLSGVWWGKYQGLAGRDHVLVVEEIDERAAVVVYAWGPGQDPKEVPGWVRGRAEVFANGLDLLIMGHETTVSYRPASEGQLRGTWQSGGRIAHVLLARRRESTDPAQARPSLPGGGPLALARASALAHEAWHGVLDGRYTEALAKAQETLAIRESLHGPHHPEVAAALSILGEVYRGLGRFEDAERVHQRALTIREGALGRDHPDVAASLSYLAMLHNARATYVAAESLLVRALKILEQVKETPARNNRLQADVLENLAKIYRALGRTAEAEEAMARAMVLWTAQ